MRSTLGAQLSALRRRRAMSQRDLAERAGVSVDLVRKLEQGQRHATRIASLTALANALDVTPADLLGKPRGLPAGRVSGEVGAIRRAVLGVREPAVEPPVLDDLRTEGREAWRLYWAGRYAELARDLPALIAGARAAVEAATDRAAAAATLAELLQLTASLLAHLAHEDLAHLALAEAVRAAEASGDELLFAGQQATRSWVLSRQGLWSEAEHVAVTAAEQVEPALSRASIDQVAVWGELLRYGTTAVARSGRQSEAQEMLGLVRAAAARMAGDQRSTYVGMAFGPTVAAMKAVDVAIAADRPRQAIKLAERVEHPEAAPTAMHARYLLNVAWAQMTDWRSQDAVDTLRTVEALAAEMLPHQTIVHTIIAELLPRRRKQRLPGLVGLAERIGIAAGG
ncbi:helix-turn-helix domain-containing protein [Phytohabitans sp. LJ34]|uniref:helix-turn-helix domain-containing protein n=1 Tax=Phytohabitans sp. LJ34 TaxID=3452217 RepID=UPI003F8A5EB2